MAEATVASGQQEGATVIRRKKTPKKRQITLAELAELTTVRRSLNSSGDSFDEVDGCFSPLDSLHARSLEALWSSGSSDNYLFPTGHKDASPSSATAVRQALGGLSNLDDFDRVKIGAGFYGDVYKVTQRSTGRVMVLKMNRFIDSQNRVRNLTEIEVMRTLDHKNVLKFIGACISEGNIHPLVEYVNGGNLEELLSNEDRELSWTVKLQMSRDIADGMRYLHSQSIVHRDLTSKNCLLKDIDGALVAVVADFGLVAKFRNSDNGRSPCLTRRLRKASSVVGSPYWMAPEVLNGKSYNEKADVFSYGIVICEIIARVNADPEELPRTSAYGLDEGAFGKMCDDLQCPDAFLCLAFQCCQINPEERRNFEDIFDQLQAMIVDIDDSDAEYDDDEDQSNAVEGMEAINLKDDKLMTVPDGAILPSTPLTSMLHPLPRHRKTRSMGRCTPPAPAPQLRRTETLMVTMTPPLVADGERSHSMPGSPRLSPALTPSRRSLRYRVHTDSISTPSRCVDALRMLRARKKRRVDSDSDNEDTEVSGNTVEESDRLGKYTPVTTKSINKIDKSLTL